jgi:hypothetical protein
MGVRDGHANDEAQSISPSDLSAGLSISTIGEALRRANPSGRI